MLTVPQYFNDEQKEIVRQACISAGFEDADTITEPIAALQPFRKDSEEEKNVLVLHLGGSSCEVTILRTAMNANQEYKKLANFHNEKVGGQTLDNILTEYFKDELRAQHDQPLDDPKILDAIEQKAKTVKVKLSKIEETKIQVFIG